MDQDRPRARSLLPGKWQVDTRLESNNRQKAYNRAPHFFALMGNTIAFMRDFLMSLP
jgi:hypothetical protein